MAVEVIDQVARDELIYHETTTDPHGGVYALATGDSILPYAILASPTKVWKLTIDDDGILTATEVTV